MAAELDIPLIIHDREAHGDTVDILRKYGKGCRGVFHCDSGSYEMAKEFKNTGFSNFSNKLFAIYGTTDEIRNLFIEKRINSDGKAIDMLVLDIVVPEKVKTLWVMPETSENVDKVTNYWKTNAKQGLNKEYEGGKIFSFETNSKIVTIKKQVDSLDEIRGLLKNRLKGIDDNSELGKYNIKGVIYD